MLGSACIASAQGFAQGFPRGTLPAAENLRLDAERMRAQGLPMVVLFSSPGCSWCDQVRRDHLAPMSQDAYFSTRALFREVRIDSAAQLEDFAGRRSTQRVFAQLHDVSLVPTVMFFGPDGSALVEPIVGARLNDFYTAYVEQAIDEARAAIRVRTP